MCGPAAPARHDPHDAADRLYHDSILTDTDAAAHRRVPSLPHLAFMLRTATFAAGQQGEMAFSSEDIVGWLELIKYEVEGTIAELEYEEKHKAKLEALEARNEAKMDEVRAKLQEEGGQ